MKEIIKFMTNITVKLNQSPVLVEARGDDGKIMAHSATSGGDRKMRILTTDIYEGSYLLSKGMKLEKLWLKGNDPKRSVIFEFAGPDAELLRNDYLKGDASANVLKLKQALTELKDRMFTLIRAREEKREYEYQYSYK
jgi:hypothetical protein